MVKCQSVFHVRRQEDVGEDFKVELIIISEIGEKKLIKEEIGGEWAKPDRVYTAASPEIVRLSFMRDRSQTKTYKLYVLLPVLCNRTQTKAYKLIVLLSFTRDRPETKTFTLLARLSFYVGPKTYGR